MRPMPHAAWPLRFLLFAVALAVASSTSPAVAADDEKEQGFTSLFDGKTLEGWDGDPKFWSVRNGAITGQTTKDNPTKGNTFIVWDGEVADFELRLDYRIQGGNSGIQYRSFRLDNAPDKWRIGGYQADIDSGETYSGIVYGEKARGILTGRGEKCVITTDGKECERFGDSKEIQSKIKKDGWNSYRIVAKGYHLTQYINGVKTAELIDQDERAQGKQMLKGLLALQLHAGPPMTVQFKNIRVKRYEGGEETSAVPSERELQFVSAEKDVKKIVLIAGRKSHGYGAHEHRAGCMLLAEHLNASGLPVKAEVVTEGWPKDESILDDADAIVIYADGGGGHPFNKHLDKIDELMDEGVGLVAIHYGVEVPKGDPGEAFLDWTGGYFETNWSVNPHWKAEYEQLAEHPTTRGVEPFSLQDEWYYHMRFRDQGVTPILTDLPPKETLERPDGPHSGNPAVRKAVLEEKQPQHMAWAREREDGGRGFGITGGHFHWNWGHDDFRQLVLNAIVWTADVEVPKTGVPTDEVTVEDLMANQDYEVPENFNPARIEQMLEQWNGRAPR